MKFFKALPLTILVMALVLSACAPAVTEPSTFEAPGVDPTEVPEVVVPDVGLTCADPIKVGLITDLSGALAIYGAHILPSFMLGMEYATGAAGSAGATFSIAEAQDTTFTVDDCDIQVFVRDDASTPDNTATVARELIEVQGVDILVGTVSSGATATLQGIAAENMIPLIVAPAAANDITGVNFNEYTFRTSRNNYQDAMNECLYLTTQYSTLADDIFAPADTTDFTPYMEQVLDSGAESYIVTWAGGGFVPLMQAATDLGVSEAMALGATFIYNILMPIWYGNAIGSTSGILYHYSAPDNAANDFLVAEMKARYGVMPDLFAGDGMNAAIMLVEGLQASDGDASAAALIAVFEGMSFEGPKGTVYIRPEDHVAIQNMYVLKLLNLTDPDANFYEYVETIRPEPPCLLPDTLVDRCGDLPVGSLSGQ